MSAMPYRTWAEWASAHHASAVELLLAAADGTNDLLDDVGRAMIATTAQTYATLAVAAATRADTEARERG